MYVYVPPPVEKQWNIELNLNTRSYSRTEEFKGNRQWRTTHFSFLFRFRWMKESVSTFIIPVGHDLKILKTFLIYFILLFHFTKLIFCWSYFHTHAKSCAFLAIYSPPRRLTPRTWSISFVQCHYKEQKQTSVTMKFILIIALSLTVPHAEGEEGGQCFGCDVDEFEAGNGCYIVIGRDWSVSWW